MVSVAISNSSRFLGSKSMKKGYLASGRSSDGLGPTTTWTMAPWHGWYELSSSVSPSMVSTLTPFQSMVPWISSSSAWYPVSVAVTFR